MQRGKTTMTLEGEIDCTGHDVGEEVDSVAVNVAK